ncbi:BRO family protein [Streptomyces anthocyanicus]|uniref:BRO family protein n=1 Tax=Streptomyces anthocyanicus TaxID=68174 RepID=UPI0038075EF2
MPIVASPDDPGDSQGVERFTFQGAEIRSVILNGEPWWVATDATKILGYRNAGDATRLLDEDEKGTHSVRTLGGEQLVTIINEPGLYSLILRSKLPRAKDFKRWITHEVIPSIRKTGGYGRPTLPSNRDLALMVIAEADRADFAEARVKELEPAASSWQTLAAAQGDLSVADAAKILSRDRRISVGRNRLFAAMLEMRWLYRQQSDGRPRAMQTAVERGWLSELPQSHTHPESKEIVIDPPQVRVTVKGLGELHKRLGGSGDLAIAG